MVSGILKSRRLKRVSVKTTTENVTHYRQRNRNAPVCAITKKPLRGMSRGTNKQYGKLNKSQKRISRPFGGYMGHNALRTKIFEEMVENK